METEDLIYGKTEYTLYGKPIKYYSYWDCEQKYMVVTDDYNEYRAHFERNRFGGNNGIHLGFLKQDPPISIGPQFVK